MVSFLIKQQERLGDVHQGRGGLLSDSHSSRLLSVKLGAVSSRVKDSFVVPLTFLLLV